MITGEKPRGGADKGGALEDKVDDDLNGDEAEADEFADADDDEVSPDLDEFDAEVEDGGEDIDAVVEMSSKEQSARSLEVRRAIEARMEKKKLSEDIDYLDLDFDD